MLYLTLTNLHLVRDTLHHRDDSKNLPLPDMIRGPLPILISGNSTVTLLSSGLPSSH